MKRALFLALLLTGCAQILDLEKRELAADAGSVVANEAGPADANAADADTTLDATAPFVDPDSGVLTTTACVEYCSLGEQLCTPEKSLQLFQKRDTCLAVCGKYATGPSESGNTLACRLKVLRDLQRIGSNEAVTYCQAAGPGGGAPPSELNGVSCGTDCGGFCKLREATCPRMEGDVECERKCQALVNDKTYNANADFGSGEDTLSCRLAHLSAAALYDATEMLNDAGTKFVRNLHCDHSGIRSKQQCDYPEDKAPDCDAYCKIVANACSNEKAVFESNEQCVAFCTDGLIDGKSASTSDTGSKRCHRAGAYDALEGQANGCQRAAITGDGCLNGRAGSYCFFAKKACPTQFAQAFAGNTEEDCRAKVASLPFASINEAFAVGSAAALSTQDNMQCRMRRLLKFYGGDKSANNCAAALGLPGNTFCVP